MTINERLKDLLKASKHTQLELSEAIQTPKSTVNTWVKLGRDIPAQFIIPICGFLGCSAEYLLTGQETKKHPALGDIPENGVTLLRIFLDLPQREQDALLGEARGLQLATEIHREPPTPASSDERAG